MSGNREQNRTEQTPAAREAEYERRMTCPRCGQYGDGCNCDAASSSGSVSGPTEASVIRQPDPDSSTATECYRHGKRTLHVFAKESDKEWPYDGQVCVCGQVKFKAGYGAVKP